MKEDFYLKAEIHKNEIIWKKTESNQASLASREYIHNHIYTLRYNPYNYRKGICLWRVPHFATYSYYEQGMHKMECDIMPEPVTIMANLHLDHQSGMETRTCEPTLTLEFCGSVI